MTDKLEFLVDLDDTLLDWRGAAARIHGLFSYRNDLWNVCEAWEIPDAAFWKPIHALGDDFYGRHVRPYPWAQNVLQLLDCCGRVILLSSPGPSTPLDYKGKAIARDLHFPGRKLCVWDEKFMLAADNRVLIDDSDANCAAFRLAGGHCIHFPQPWNDARRYVSNDWPTSSRVNYISMQVGKIQEQVQSGLVAR